MHLALAALYWLDGMITRHPSTCAAQSGRTYAARGKDIVRLETIIIRGLAWITRQQQQQQVKWAGVFCGLCAPVFVSIVVVVIDIDFLGFSVR